MQPITPLTVPLRLLLARVSAGKASVDDVAGEKKPAVVDVTVAFAAGGVGVVVDGRQTTAQPAGRAAVLGLGGGTTGHTLWIMYLQAAVAGQKEMALVAGTISAVGVGVVVVFHHTAALPALRCIVVRHLHRRACCR